MPRHRRRGPVPHHRRCGRDPRSGRCGEHGAAGQRLPRRRGRRRRPVRQASRCRTPAQAVKELTRAGTELGLCSVLVNGYSNLGADKLYLDEDRFMRAIKHTRRCIVALAASPAAAGLLETAGMTSSAHASARTTTASGPKSSIVLVHGAWADSSSSVTDRLPGRVTVRHPDMCGGGRDCAGRIEAVVGARQRPDPGSVPRIYFRYRPTGLIFRSVGDPQMIPADGDR